MREEFDAIKPERISEIFRAATEKSRITRARIAQRTGLSVMTVGKVVNALTDMKILRQTVSIDQNPGRKARLLSVNRDLFFAVFDLSAKDYRLYICDLAYNVMDRLSYRYNDNYFIDENLRFFFNRAIMNTGSSFSISNCCGAGILVPGNYDPETDRVSGEKERRLASIPIKKLLGEYISIENVCVGNARRLAALEMYKLVEDDKSVLCIFADRDSMKSCYLHGAPSDELKLMPMECTYIEKGKTLGDYLQFHRNPEIMSAILAQTVFNICTTVPVDTVALSGELYRDIHSFALVFKDRLSSICLANHISPPEVLDSGLSEPGVKAVCAYLREKWFVSTVLES